jgi:hypothetical protein
LFQIKVIKMDVAKSKTCGLAAVCDPGSGVEGLTEGLQVY